MDKGVLPMIQVSYRRYWRLVPYLCFGFPSTSSRQLGLWHISTQGMWMYYLEKAIQFQSNRYAEIKNKDGCGYIEENRNHNRWLEMEKTFILRIVVFLLDECMKKHFEHYSCIVRWQLWLNLTHPLNSRNLYKIW